ncbi:MAG: hypothetical protein AAGG01_10475 [Planctomycetota bacterium]
MPLFHSTLCLLAPVAFSVPQTPPTESHTLQALAVEGDPSPFAGSDGVPWTYQNFLQLSSSPSGDAWRALARVRSPDGTEREVIVIGQREGEAGAGPAAGPITIYRPPSAPGAPVPDVQHVSTAEGRTVTLERTSAAGSGADELRIDGAVHITRNDAISGRPSWQWVSFDRTWLTDGGGLFVRGTGRRPNGGPRSAVLADDRSGEVLLDGVSVVSGLNRRIDAIENVWPSRSGNHWAAVVQLRGSSRRAVLLDGDAYELEPGRPLQTEDPTPDAVAAVLGDGTWLRFFHVGVNQAGDVAVSGRVLVGSARFYVTLLNGRLVDWSPDSQLAIGMGITESGVPITRVAAAIRTPRTPLNSPDAAIDLTGDGTPDGTWSLWAIFQSTLMDEHAPIRTLGAVTPAPADNRRAILFIRAPEISRTICEGNPSSIGQSAALAAIGSPIADSNEVTLEAYQLPPSARGHALLARSAIAPTTPPGSDGELCLGSPMARRVGGLFVASQSGVASVLLDLTDVPLSTGPASVLAGETWYAQAWYRDAVGSAPTSNFTDALELAFR